MASKRPAAGDKSFSAVVAEGNRRQSLEALRDGLARAIEVAEPSVVAQIAAQLRATLKEIAELPDTKKVSKADELAARRKDRRAKATAATSARRKSNQQRG